MTIVPEEKLEKDPRMLAYHYKSMTLIAYYKSTAKYYFWRLVKTIEDAAKQNGRVLVPSECFHWRRKEELKEFHILIFKKGFYQVPISDLSEPERNRYLSIVTN